MVKPRKVYTPGSQPPGNKKGRPRKKNEVSIKCGTVRKGNYRSKYTMETLTCAIQACQEGKSIRIVAKEFGIPRATLQDRVSGRTQSHVGRPFALSETEELMIVERVQVNK